MLTVLITFLFSSFLPNNKVIIKAMTSQIVRLRKNVGHVSIGGQLLPIGGTGYSKILKGNPPTAIGLFMFS